MSLTRVFIDSFVFSTPYQNVPLPKTCPCATDLITLNWHLGFKNPSLWMHLLVRNTGARSLSTCVKLTIIVTSFPTDTISDDKNFKSFVWFTHYSSIEYRYFLILWYLLYAKQDIYQLKLLMTISWMELVYKMVKSTIYTSPTLAV